MLHNNLMHHPRSGLQDLKSFATHHGMAPNADCRQAILHCDYTVNMLKEIQQHFVAPCQLQNGLPLN